MTKQDVRELLETLASGKLAARGKPTKVVPSNLKALLSKFFDWAAGRNILAGNPAAGVKLPDRVREHLRKGGKDRVLSDEEIGILWDEIDELEADSAPAQAALVSATAFRLILLTAQRLARFRMQWREIEDGVWWLIPAEGGQERRGEPLAAFERNRWPSFGGMGS